MIISVGMIAYNAAPVIEAAIKSTYYFVDEIIVVDGSRLGPSTDETKKIAESFGDKVRVIQGTFAKPTGGWDERGQRQAYLDAMYRGDHHWGLLQDADEVYSKENICRLIAHMMLAAPETKVLSHGFVHFWRNLHQVMTGGHWSRPRDVCAFRLTKDVRITGLCQCGERDDEYFGRDGYKAEILNDVFSYHYGHALNFDRLYFKVQEYYLSDYFMATHGLKDKVGQTLEEFMAAYKVKYYSSQPGIRPYDGPQPEAILPLIGSYFQ